MTAKELICTLNDQATEGLFRAARAGAADKLEWKPGEKARSALDIARECALSPTWATELLETRKMPEFNETTMAEYEAKKNAIPSLDAAEALAKENVAALNAAIGAFPESDLRVTMHVPFGPNPNWPFYNVMMLHVWNCHYHTGQLNYIQTLYGDTDFH